MTAVGPWRVYWGDLHGHTENSDGQGSLDHYFTYARDTARLDFVAVTDHDYSNTAPWRVSQALWAEATAKAEQYTVDGRFVGIAGYEWTTNPRYWTDVGPRFGGPARYYNHKTVYFPGTVPDLFAACEVASNTPDLLAALVRPSGGLIHNNHLDPGQWPGEFDYSAASAQVIANSEIRADTVYYGDRTYIVQSERALRAYLRAGGRTGFVAGTDTHEGRPVARTAVLAAALTRPALFDALRARRTYAVSHAPIGLDVRINGHFMGEEIAIRGAPRIAVRVSGTDLIEEVSIVRDGAVLHTVHPGARKAAFDHVDTTFAGASWYYVRVVQADRDPHGNHSRAWSSPSWVRAAD